MKKINFLLLTAIYVFLNVFVFSQDTLVSWTFPTGTASDSIATKAISINSMSVIKTFGGTSAIDFSKNGSTTKAAQVTGWDNGMYAKGWIIGFKSTNYNQLSLYSKQQGGGSYPGPRDFKVQYKLGNTGNWTDVPGSKITCDNLWNGALNNLSLPDSVNNRSFIVYLRWVMTSDTNINAGVVASTGISKIDDIFVRGLKIPSSGMNNDLQEKTLSIWPNPGNGSFQISYPENIRSFEVMDLSGKSILNKDVNKTLQNYPIDLTKTGKGIYLLRLTSDEKTVFRKIVID